MFRKEYLGTFDWGLSFSGLMILCFAIVACMLPICVRREFFSITKDREMISKYLERRVVRLDG